MRIGIPPGKLVTHMLSFLLQLFLPLQLLLFSLLPHVQLLVDVPISLRSGVLSVNYDLLFASFCVGPYFMLIVAVRL